MQRHAKQELTQAPHLRLVVPLRMAPTLYELQPRRQPALPDSTVISLSNTGLERVQEARLVQVKDSRQQLHVLRALVERLVICLASLLFTENATRATTVLLERGRQALMELLIQQRRQQVAFVQLATSPRRAPQCLLHVRLGRISALQP